MPYRRQILWLFAGALLFSALPVVFGNYGLYLGSALCVWIIFALAYDLAFGRAGLLSFGHAMFFGVGAYALALLVLTLDWGFWPAITAAIVLAGAFALVLGKVALQVTGHAFVVITVIFSAILELVAFSQKWITNGEDGLSFDLYRVPFGFAELDLRNANTKYWVLIAALFLTFLMLNWINNSTLGLAFRAVRENPMRATLLGYHVQHYKLAALGISGALSGLAGALFSLLSFHISAEVFQITVSINPLTSVLVGGAGTMLGPVVGTTFIFLFSDYLRTLVVYADFAIGVILVLTVLFAPQGIVGLIERIKARRRARTDNKAEASLSPNDESIAETRP